MNLQGSLYPGSPPSSLAFSPRRRRCGFRVLPRFAHWIRGGSGVKARIYFGEISPPTVPMQLEFNAKAQSGKGAKWAHAENNADWAGKHEMVTSKSGTNVLKILAPLFLCVLA